MSAGSEGRPPGLPGNRGAGNGGPAKQRRVAPATAGAKPKETVQSGLAKRRKNPVLAFLSDFGQGVSRFLTKDLLTTFLLIASILLVIAFFVLLGSLSPGRIGGQFPLSRVTDLANQHQIADATLLDYDNRVVVDMYGGERFYANTPARVPRPSSS